MPSSETITNVVELAVGLGCLAAGVGAWRRRPLRWVAVLLLVAGLAAVAHAVASMAG
jgi:peptidoglycan/LPS O-acetylase OafA/YrhL